MVSVGCVTWHLRAALLNWPVSATATIYWSCWSVIQFIYNCIKIINLVDDGCHGTFVIFRTIFVVWCMTMIIIKHHPLHMMEVW